MPVGDVTEKSRWASFRVACDTEIAAGYEIQWRRYERHSLEWRLHEASYLMASPEVVRFHHSACSFAPERLTLAGRIRLLPGQDARAAETLAMTLLAWTMQQQYGHELLSGGLLNHRFRRLSLSVRET